jgi:hypothetical protein
LGLERRKVDVRRSRSVEKDVKDREMEVCKRDVAEMGKMVKQIILLILAGDSDGSVSHSFVKKFDIHTSD